MRKKRKNQGREGAWKNKNDKRKEEEIFFVSFFPCFVLFLFLFFSSFLFFYFFSSFFFEIIFSVLIFLSY
jgi:membrane protein insertase Oxa1/YidC/SpoIIIJ